MSKQLRLVITAAVIVGLLAAASALLSPPAEGNDPLVLKSSAPSDIKSVSIGNAYGSYDITAEGEGYVPADIPPVLLDIEEFYSLMTYCAAVNAKQVVDRSPEDLSLYGLDSPAATVDIAYNDGSALKLNIGDRERLTDSYYMSVEGSEVVYLIEEQRSALFLLPRKDFVNDVFTPPLQMSSPFSAVRDVTFTGGPLSEPVTLKAVTGDNPDISRLAASFGAPTHLVMGRGVYEFDQTYGVGLLSSLLSLTANDIVDYNLTPAQIDDFGFASPYMQVEFDLKNGIDAQIVRYSLKLIQKGELYYMTCNDNGVIYEVPRPLFADIKYEKLPVRFFLSPMLADLDKVELAAGEQAYTFSLSGKSKEDRAVTLNGQPLDIERFYKFYELITSAAHDGTMLQGVKPEGSALLTLTYHYLDEKKQPDVMKLYKGDTLRNYVEINGVTEFAMLETYSDRVKQALGILQTTQTIETEW